MTRRRDTADYDWIVVWSEPLLSMIALPVDDVADHRTDDPHCWCCPLIEDAVIVHQARDGRQRWERYRREDDAA